MPAPNSNALVILEPTKTPLTRIVGARSDGMAADSPGSAVIQ